MDNTCPAETFGAGIYPSIPITFLNILNDTSVKRALGLMFDNIFILTLQAQLAWKVYKIEKPSTAITSLGDAQKQNFLLRHFKKSLSYINRVTQADANNNGSLDKNEIRNYLQNNGYQIPPNYSSLLNQADSSGDGQLQLREFCNFMNSMQNGK
uniref:EF-hand domain-containing protein n=1 Tax=Acrobeloides nanus TaxID=290746 RepID=A0A914DUR9_9BILA